MRPSHVMNASNLPELYERWLVAPLFRPWVDDLLDRVKLAPVPRLQTAWDSIR